LLPGNSPVANHPASDVDLVVVMRFRGSATEQVVAIRGRVEAPFPMDLLVWRPAEQRKTDSFTRGILCMEHRCFGHDYSYRLRVIKSTADSGAF
jgi:hypothetical protein